MAGFTERLCTLVGAGACLFGYRRLEEESAWRWWPAAIGHVTETPLRGYRVWQDYTISLPLYIMYKYLVRDRPGVFLSVPYTFTISEGSRRRAVEVLSGSGASTAASAAAATDVTGTGAVVGETHHGTAELRVTRDLKELLPDEARAAAKSEVVDFAASQLPVGQEVVVHYNPSMAMQNVVRPPSGFCRFTDGEMEGITVLNVGILLLIYGRRGSFASVVFRKRS